IAITIFHLNVIFFFSSRRRHTSFSRDWSSDVCSSDLLPEIQTRPPPISALMRSRDKPLASASALSSRAVPSSTPSMMLPPMLQYMGMALLVSRPLIAWLIHEAQTAAPEECCGILLGTG